MTKKTDIEVELKRMLENEPQQTGGERKSMHEIEVSLKKMLNVNQSVQSEEEKQEAHSHGVVITKEDLMNIGTVKSTKDAKKLHVQKKDKKSNHPPDLDHHHHHEHQEDPLTVATPVESKTAIAKKARRPKKKKNKDAKGNCSEDNQVDEDQPFDTQFNLEFHQAKYLDDKLTPLILNELVAENIFPLKKKSSKFVHAKYFCRLCDYHCDNIPVSRQHANDARHRRRKEIMLQDKMLKNLPDPSERHIAALDNMVEDIYKKHGLTDEEIVCRQTVVDGIQDFITATIPNVRLCMYGSSLTGFGLKTSDLNMDLVIPSGTNPAHRLSEVYKIICQSEKFTDVKSDFQAKVPSVLFTSSCGTLRCQITVGSELACLTSQYLAIYSQLDDRLRKLAVTFKYWARVCELDDQERGSLPAYCYGLMTVFYLQQDNPPVLPVLWKDLSEKALKRPKTKDDVQNMLTELQQQSWTSENEHTVGVLWKDMLMYYCVHFDLTENIIGVRSLKVIPRAEKKWKSRRIAIEDPFLCKRNVARSLQNLRMFDYFYNCLRKAGVYFSLPTSHQNINIYYKCKRKTSYLAKENERKSRLETAKTSQILETQTVSKAQGSSGIAELASGCEINVNEESGAVMENEKILVADLTNSTETSSDCSIKENQFFEDCKLEYERISSGDPESSQGETENDYDESDLVHEFDSLSIKTTDQSNKSNESKKVKVQTDTLFESCTQNQSEKDVIDRTNCDKLERNDQIGADYTAVDSIVNDSNSCPNHVKQDMDQGTGMYEKTLINSGGKHDEAIPESGRTGAHIYLESENDSEKVQAKSVEQTANEVVKDVVDTVIAQVVDDTCNKVTGESEDVNNTTECMLDQEIENITDTCTINIEFKDGNEKELTDDKSAVLLSDGETSSGLSLGSDMDAESPDASPLMKRKKLVSSPVGAEYEFMFDSRTLTDGKGPSVFCQICEKEGHLKMNCPEDKLPDLNLLPAMTSVHLQMLTSVIKQVPRDFKLTQNEIDDREFVRNNLELYIHQLYPDAQLRLFGSSVNGFGFHQSDLDICVTFKDKDEEEMNFVEHIEAICKRLKTHRGLYGVFPITTAKVPIVKFTHRNTRLEGDISMYNILAMQNTRLLYTYACIDPRVQTLGYAIKVFAKVCDIGDASRGSLSSYAYMLMMIHYLQHTKPPLIPVLQEIRTENNPNPENVVEGWNTWFYDNITDLPYIWSGYGTNHKSVGELWLGFFRYYLEEFSFTDQVVTIRQFQPLTKFEKLWNGKCIAIEDPFDLDHNLGGGLSRKMNHYIQCTYIHARELYGMCIGSVPDGFFTIQDYFFDKQQLVDGDPPSDRLCRVCSKIGHIARECPRLLAKKEREERRRNEDMKKLDIEGLKGSPQRNRGPQKYNNRDGQNTSRSFSDPSNDGSPVRGQGHQHVYQRQYSQPHSQSPDKRQMRPLLDVHVHSPDRFTNGNYHGSRSQNQQNFSTNQRPQSNPTQTHVSPGPTSQAYRQTKGYGNQSNQQYYNRNQSDNSSKGYGTRPGPQYAMKQNYDLRSQRNFMQQGDPNHYPSSPMSGRHQPQYSNQFYEGMPQSPLNPERKVNVQKSGYRGNMPDVGITVRNEYFNFKDQ